VEIIIAGYGREGGRKDEWASINRFIDAEYAF